MGHATLEASSKRRVRTQEKAKVKRVSKVGKSKKEASSVKKRMSENV